MKKFIFLFLFSLTAFAQAPSLNQYGTRTSKIVPYPVNATQIDFGTGLKMTGVGHGITPSNVTTTQRLDIVSPNPGEIVYDTTIGAHYQWNGSAWVSLSNPPQTLDETLTVGNTSDKSIILSEDTYQNIISPYSVALGSPNLTGGTQVTEMSPGSMVMQDSTDETLLEITHSGITHSVGSAITKFGNGQISTYDSSNGKIVSLSVDGVQIKTGTSGHTTAILSDNVTNANFLQTPNTVAGTFTIPISVNGEVADTSGNITISAGTVNSVAVSTANGFAGSSSGGATPSLTISTTATGVLKGNGTAISAATAETDYTTPTGAGALTNKTMSGVTNTFTNIPQSAVTNLTTDLANKQNIPFEIQITQALSSAPTILSGSANGLRGATLTTNYISVGEYTIVADFPIFADAKDCYKGSMLNFNLITDQSGALLYSYFWYISDDYTIVLKTSVDGFSYVPSDGILSSPVLIKIEYNN